MVQLIKSDCLVASDPKWLIYRQQGYPRIKWDKEKDSCDQGEDCTAFAYAHHALYETRQALNNGL